MTEKEGQPEISITIPLEIINDMLYSKTFVEETDPIYDKELQGKAIIAGKNVTLLRFRRRLKLTQIQIRTTTNGRTKLAAKPEFHFSPTDDEDNHEDDYPDEK